ncbi:MAG: hypothetical protein ACKOEE_02605 [Tagaea sp.]
MLEAILRRPARVERVVEWLLLIAKSAVVLGLAVVGARLLGLAV